LKQIGSGRLSCPDPNSNLFLDLHSGDFPDFLPGFIARKSRWQNATFSYNKAGQFRSKFLLSVIDWNAISGDG
jgi:hypothetical protein